MSAREWRQFWRDRGMRELRLVLWASWDPIGSIEPSPEEDTRSAEKIGDWFDHAIRTRD
jgi:hypothetical protein